MSRRILAAIRRVAILVVILPVSAAASGASAVDDVHVRVDTGLRQADLDWSIAGNSANVLSELIWSDLQTFQIRGDVGVDFHERVALGGSLTLGSIMSGDNRDSDYGGDNRSLEFSRSENAADDTYMLDTSLGLEIDLLTRAPEGRNRLVGKLGFFVAKQNLRITRGFQTVSEPSNVPQGTSAPPPVGPIDGLDSTYKARWRGPWAGLEYQRRLGLRSMLTVETRLHWTDYDAEANWNLRDDLEQPRSFAHVTSGQGLSFSVTWARFFETRLPFYLRLDVDDWSTDAGTHRSFQADGSQRLNRLNDVNRTATALSIGRIFR